MKLTGLLTTAMVLGFAGMAAAECNWGSHSDVAASTEYTPIPTADASDATETPVLVLPTDQVTEEG
ncbi:MAG: hypothetical protein AAF813_06010 [Pseudomonadota bacterium]